MLKQKVGIILAICLAVSLCGNLWLYRQVTVTQQALTDAAEQAAQLEQQNAELTSKLEEAQKKSDNLQKQIVELQNNMKLLENKLEESKIAEEPIPIAVSPAAPPNPKPVTPPVTTPITTPTKPTTPVQSSKPKTPQSLPQSQQPASARDYFKNKYGIEPETDPKKGNMGDVSGELGGMRGKDGKNVIKPGGKGHMTAG